MTKYLWTEDTKSGLHFWQLMTEHLFNNEVIVESKGNNQGILDAVRNLKPRRDEIYYIAFDLVYDNMDIVNKWLELQQLAQKYSKQVVLLDMVCFEYLILNFSHLPEWTRCGKKDKIHMREIVLGSLVNHRIDIENITDEKTLSFLAGFKNFSTERVLKSITYELTDSAEWGIKGSNMGKCWTDDCCVLDYPDKAKCGLKNVLGKEKLLTLFRDETIASVIAPISSVKAHTCNSFNNKPTRLNAF